MSSVDFPGRSTLNAEAVLIADLDGTLLSVNSFPLWASYMLKGRFAGLTRKERLDLCMGAARTLAARKLLRRSHAATKYALQQLWSLALSRDITEEALRNLNATLLAQVRPNLSGLMAALRDQQLDAILATSAAGEYARPLGKDLGFTHILTTPPAMESDRRENGGERKRDRVLGLLRALRWEKRLRVFMTDHEEDLPLIRECQTILWFGAPEDMESVQVRAPWSRLIACREIPEAAIMRLIGSRSQPLRPVPKHSLINRQ